MGNSIDPQNDAEFDAYAGRYAEMHSAVLGITGESPEYFAHYKLQVLERIEGNDSRPLLDYGCGIGNLTSVIARSRTNVHGYDPSGRSLRVAKDRAPSATFHDDLETVPRGVFGTVVLANVLHHVPPDQRLALVAGIRPLLAPEGRVVVFEHNRRNPLTVRAVRRCEFDRGVELLTCHEIRSLLDEAGLVRTGRQFMVFFPRALRPLRGLEPRLGALPVGAQVCVWAHLAT